MPPGVGIALSVCEVTTTLPGLPGLLPDTRARGSLKRRPEEADETEPEQDEPSARHARTLKTWRQLSCPGEQKDAEVACNRNPLSAPAGHDVLFAIDRSREHGIQLLHHEGDMKP